MNLPFDKGLRYIPVPPMSKAPPPIKIGNRNFLTETILRKIRGERTDGGKS